MERFSPRYYYLFLLFGFLVFTGSIQAQWTLSLDTDEIIFYKDAIQANQKYIFCNTYRDVYRSGDKGQTWELVFDSGDEFYAYVDNMFVQDSRIWIVGDWTLGEYLIEYSGDNGTTWQSLTNNGYPKNCIINYNDVLFMGCPYYPPETWPLCFVVSTTGKTGSSS